jgi:hypothetical protein
MGPGESAQNLLWRALSARFPTSGPHVSKTRSGLRGGNHLPKPVLATVLNELDDSGIGGVIQVGSFRRKLQVIGASRSPGYAPGPAVSSACPSAPRDGGDGVDVGSGWTLDRIGDGAFHATRAHSEYTGKYEDFELAYSIYVPTRPPSSRPKETWPGFSPGNTPGPTTPSRWRPSRRRKPPVDQRPRRLERGEHRHVGTGRLGSEALPSLHPSNRIYGTGQSGGHDDSGHGGPEG